MSLQAEGIARATRDACIAKPDVYGDVRRPAKKACIKMSRGAQTFKRSDVKGR
jgi:hypothetical protein